ncbi:MAG: 16S rRNA (adenine(1518)-N(6)/adenine(1519)-N(6))-dimethyltransferase RsmA [Nitrospirota bacterium]
MSADLRPRKSLGQCFLTDPRIAEKIVSLGGVDPSDRVVEIGPGRGILTRVLAERAVEVLAIELDPRWSAALREEFAGNARVHVEQADALAYPFEDLAPGFKVIANLPYNISTPILFRLLGLRDRVTLMVLMLQREVVDRLLARPGSKAYGALSVAVAYAADVRKGFAVAAGSFSPRPAVESAVVVITPRGQPAIVVRDEPTLMRVIRAAFAHRRKVLANALTDEGFAKPAVIAALQESRIDPTRRGETLSLEEFGWLADAVIART